MTQDATPDEPDAPGAPDVPDAPDVLGARGAPDPPGAPAESVATDTTRATGATAAPHATPGSAGASAVAPAVAAGAGDAPRVAAESPEGRTAARAPDPVPAADSDAAPALSAALEAILLVTDEPVAAVMLAQVVERPTEEVERSLRLLAEEYTASGRGFELRAVAGGWRLYTRADCAPYVERFVLDGQQARLTQAALETLAVIAYRQPVTRARVSAVRGVNVDGVVRTLLARGLVTEAGHDPDTGGILYRTTPLLLERLGLQSLEELPSLAPFLPEPDEVDSASSST